MDDCKILGRDRSRDSQLDFWGDLCMRLYSCKNMQAMSVVAIIACYTLGLFWLRLTLKNLGRVLHFSCAMQCESGQILNDPWYVIAVTHTLDSRLKVWESQDLDRFVWTLIPSFFLLLSTAETSSVVHTQFYTLSGENAMKYSYVLVISFTTLEYNVIVVECCLLSYVLLNSRIQLFCCF